jgi:hypothetical protein
MVPLGQKCPKRLRLPAGKSTHEHMGRIVPEADNGPNANPQAHWGLGVFTTIAHVKGD